MTRCSLDAQGEPLAGTAPHTRGWLVVEHPGPYPRIASETLGALGDRLRAMCQQHGLTLVLARRPRERGRRAWLAVDGAVAEWPEIDPEDLLALPLDSIGPLATGTSRTLFICTNGKRDACCAEFGRPVTRELLAEGLPVWECSHLGGHRFAPTGLLLPDGAVHGRLTVDAARALLLPDRPVHDSIGSLRGMSHLRADHQVADIAVRRDHGIPTTTRLTVESAGDDLSRDCTVRHPDGRTWQVHLVKASGKARAESCGKEPVPSQWWGVAAPTA